MNILEKVMNAIGKGPVLTREQVRRLSGLPREQARGELGAVLYDHCVKRAADFVQGELKRPDSPYRGMAAGIFFHEVLAVTFWLMDREVAGGKGTLVRELHENYFRSFTSSEEAKDRSESLRAKYQQYDDNWNEVTGHLDEFALGVVQNIFGKEQSPRTRERSFWIIQYADELVNEFCRIRKACKDVRSVLACEPGIGG